MNKRNKGTILTRESKPLKKRSKLRNVSMNNAIPMDVLEYASANQLQITDQIGIFQCSVCSCPVESSWTAVTNHVNNLKHRKKVAVSKSIGQATTLGVLEDQSSSETSSVPCSRRFPPIEESNPVSVETSNGASNGQKSSDSEKKQVWCFHVSQKENQPLSVVQLRQVVLRPTDNDEEVSNISIRNTMQPVDGVIPWLNGSQAYKKFSNQPLNVCLTEELTYFERYLSYSNAEQLLRKEAVDFIINLIEEVTASRVQVMDGSAVEWYLPFDAILLSFVSQQWLVEWEETIAQRCKDQHWNFQRQTTRENEHWRICLVERSIDLSVQVTYQKMKTSFTDMTISSLIIDPHLHIIMLLLKYIIYQQLNVCHFGDVYCRLLLQNESLWCIGTKISSGNSLLSFLETMKDILLHCSLCYPKNDYYLYGVGELTPQGPCFHVFYNHLACLCQQVLIELEQWDEQRTSSSPLSCVLQIDNMLETRKQGKNLKRTNYWCNDGKKRE